MYLEEFSWRELNVLLLGMHSNMEAVTKADASCLWLTLVNHHDFPEEQLGLELVFLQSSLL